ncbi:MAG: hypothetical protein ACOY4D_02445 [Pseudomonadota bacterium]
MDLVLHSKGTSDQFRGSAAHGGAGIFQSPQVIEKWRKEKNHIFSFRALRIPGWNYSGLPKDA